MHDDLEKWLIVWQSRLNEIQRLSTGSKRSWAPNEELETELLGHSFHADGSRGRFLE